jgi:histidyl-tRNA synthetase
MSSSKPGIPRGTRDFGPDKMIRRNFIFENIKAIFQKFGFLPIETPAMEQLSVLTGKYGEEGDQLIFKILNSGDFAKDINLSDFEVGYKKITTSISEKALRYDLTVPFARYVVMNRNDITFPFRRYQIQPVWRGDKPAKSRYREFYQCDADVIGTRSLLCEAEIVLMINEVLKKLGIKNFSIKINNRKLLSAITEKIGMPGSEVNLCVAIDKLDKIGIDKVIEELKIKNFTELAIASLMPILEFKGSNKDKFEFMKTFLTGSETGQKGLEEMSAVFDYTETFGLKENNLEFDLTLARGLSYYTGAIFEVKANDVSIGSICGGGRYDNLTGGFGMPDVSGVGISFGIDRIYDVMEELEIFPETDSVSSKVLLCSFDEEAQKYALPLLYQLREKGINSEIYPDPAKMKKQMEYADRKKIPFVIIIGSDEMTSGKLTLKNMLKGDQERLDINSIITKLGQD